MRCPRQPVRRRPRPLEETEPLLAEPEPATDGLLRIEAPMVGTFYRASQPGAPPFVEEGDVVAAGQTLCILEAMKLMNEVKSEVEGVVRAIHVAERTAGRVRAAAVRPRARDEPAARRLLMFNRVLIANRGEVAVRVIRTLHELGIEAVAVYSTADEGALHARLADRAVCVGPPPPTESYLKIPSIIAAATTTRCDAVHPGWGFLAENPAFARRATTTSSSSSGPAPRPWRGWATRSMRSAR